MFHAECAPTEMVVVDKALFGRMELGRCVTRNYGHIGCAVDVLPVVDHACSGRRSCDLSVSDPALVRTKPCPKDFASYLDADYTCVPGAWNPLKLFTMQLCHLETVGNFTFCVELCSGGCKVCDGLSTPDGANCTRTGQLRSSPSVRMVPLHNKGDFIEIKHGNNLTETQEPTLVVVERLKRSHSGEIVAFFVMQLLRVSNLIS